MDDLQLGYRKDIDDLRKANDSKFGIASQRVTTPEGDMWVRDATQALDLDHDDRPSHDALSIAGNNALMRCLTRIRAIDYAISKDPSLTDENKKRLRQEIKTVFEEPHKKNILHYANREVPPTNTLKLIDEIEEQFNTFLVKKLHEANLTKGCTTQKDAEALLAHYKVLYSVLDPAMPLVTLTYDKASRILQRETQYPVTEKTQLQKASVGFLKTVIPHPLVGEVNAHTVHNEAEQQADACFADLLVADDRMLTSQARKSHLVGVKNAFIVKVETEGAVDADEAERMRSFIAKNPLSPMDDPNPLWLGRMAVPVYVGKGEKYTNAHVKANLEQLQMAAKKHMKHEAELKIHLTTLNTYTNIDGEKQDVMIDGLRKGMEGTNSEVSVVPTNDVGMLYTPELADSIGKKGKVQPGQKADRLDLAVDVTRAASKQAHTISFVNCAGGADRTGTVIEKAIQEHTAEKMGVDISDVAAMRARGFNSAEIAHHVVPGTPGMKPCSEANNWFGWGRKTFSELVGREFYLKSADLNKKNKVKKVDFLKEPSVAAGAEYKKAVANLEAAIAIPTEEGALFNLKKAGAAILSRAKLVEVKHNARKRDDLSKIYKLATQVIQQCETKNLSREQLNKIGLDLLRLEKMQEVFSGENKLAKRIGNFIVAAVVSISMIILLTVPWFHSILAVTGLLIVISSVKLGVSLGLWGSIAKQLALTSMGGLNTTPDHGVVEKTSEFTETGQTFFKAEKEKLDKVEEGHGPEHKK